MRTFDFSPLFRSTVGFDSLFDRLDSAGQIEAAQSYPPYNIERTDETHYRITVAVAGFAEKDLNVDVRESVLSITGKRDEAEKAEGTGYLYQGIAGRAFERRFQLAENVQVKGAALENGLLHVELERIVPEEKKPRQIPINGARVSSIEDRAKAA
ncbi:MAG TPA: Hsp20 family protein [Rhizomicrobium sp.]|jgi:molecular chaperone IbpA|nr:Hsp20 family protein [Rhizomicrobium sp.]